ncbi:MAG: phosphatase PAP2 family protein [Alphaproteobacteria bacterium]
MKKSSYRFNQSAVKINGVVCVLATLLIFFFVDKYIADFVKSIDWLVKNRQSFGFHLLDELGRAKNWVTGSGITIIGSSFFLYLKKGNRRRQKLVQYSGRIFLSVFATSMIVNAIKTFAGRYRPYNVNPDSSISFYSFQLLEGSYNKLGSFPSSHAAIAMAVVFSVYYINPKSKYLPYGFFLAGVVMVQRIITLNHYLSDIVFGAGIGILMAYTACWFWKNFIKIGER